MPSTAVRDPAELEFIFEQSEKPQTEFRVGLEAEKFAIDARGFGPIPYEGPRGVQAMLRWVAAEFGWHAESEVSGGPLLALRRGDESVTLEPGGQVELSGSPVHDVHRVAAEYARHLREMAAVSERFGVFFAHFGFHPLATQASLPWVPKRRYPIMRRYLPTKGARGLDMMLRTATVQVNLDYESEADAMDKLAVLLRLTPLFEAMTANSPFVEGRVSGRASERQDVWLNMDPARSGLLTQLWKDDTRYSDYVAWALDAGMFLFIRDGQIVENTGQTFRDFMTHGFAGHHATQEDWRLHLGTLFPAVRLKSTLEVRGCDALPPELTAAVPALLVGLCYDRVAFDLARELAQHIRPEGARELESGIVQDGVRARYDGRRLDTLCLELLEIARAGLRRRDVRDHAGQDESVHLDPLIRVIERGDSPAHESVTRASREGAVAPELIRAWFAGAGV